MKKVTKKKRKKKKNKGKKKKRKGKEKKNTIKSVFGQGQRGTMRPKKK